MPQVPVDKYVPVFLTDKRTYCIAIYQACVKLGRTPAAAKDDFVQDCAERYPTTINEYFKIGDTRYRWDFNGDYETAPKYGVSPSRNFMAYRRLGTPPPNTPFTNEQSILSKAAESEVSKKGPVDRCNFFGGGHTGVSEAPAHVLGQHGFLFEAKEPSPTLNDIGLWGGLIVGVTFVFAELFGFFSGASFSPVTPSWMGSSTPFDIDKSSRYPGA